MIGVMLLWFLLITQAMVTHPASEGTATHLTGDVHAGRTPILHFISYLKYLVIGLLKYLDIGRLKYLDTSCLKYLDIGRLKYLDIDRLKYLDIGHL